MKQFVKRVAVSKGEVHSRIPRVPRKADAILKQSLSAGWIGQVQKEKDGAEMETMPCGFAALFLLMPYVSQSLLT